MSHTRDKDDFPTMLFPDLRPNTACDYHRVVAPYQQMEQSGKIANPKVPVFWANRMPTGGLQELFAKKRAGYKVVIDIDDHWNLEPGHYLFDRFKMAGVSQTIIECLKAADAVIASTSFLASQVREHNRNVVVVPNAIDYDKGQFKKAQSKPDTFFVWAGGSSHREDLQQLPVDQNVTIAGFKPNDAEWNKILSSLGSVRLKNSKPLASYMELLDGHQCALAPLTDSAFNKCKSNLKMLEAGSKGLAFIASKVRPYFNEVDCDHVMYADSKDDFRRQMKKLMGSASMLEDYQQSLAEHVRLNYHLKDANELRRQLFESFS